MSAADDNHPKSVITLLQPALQKLKEEASPEWRETLRSIEAVSRSADGPERKE